MEVRKSKRRSPVIGGHKNLELQLWGQKIDADFLPTVAGTVFGISGQKGGYCHGPEIFSLCIYSRSSL